MIKVFPIVKNWKRRNSIISMRGAVGYGDAQSVALGLRQNMEEYLQ